jgi:two-component system sensor histidine kinase FlrB
MSSEPASLAGSEIGLAVQPSLEMEGRPGLEQAYSLFDQMSTQLTDSYSLLEARVTELKGELAVVSGQRMQELAEKERLANRLQHLLDLLPGGVIVIDGTGMVREANPAALDLLGQPLIGVLWRQVIARCFAPREDDGHEISLKDGPVGAAQRPDRNPPAARSARAP